MRILILIEAFFPETKSASSLYFDLASSLVKRGHAVSIITRLPQYNIASGTLTKQVPAQETINGINVYRVRLPLLARNIPLIRGFEHFLLGFVFFLKGLWLGKFESILVYSPPLPLGIAGYWLSQIKNCPVVVNILDLYPQTVIALGLLKNKFLIWLAERMESFIYRRSNFIIANSDNNFQHILQCGGKTDSVDIISIWADTELIKPGPKSNEFSEKYGIADKFVISFAGVMGFAQGLEVVVNTAKLLSKYQDIQFLMIGDGIKKAELIRLAGKEQLSNILFLPTQPLTIYPRILNTSDISLVILNKSLATAIPGKTFSILAGGVPLLASVPLDSGCPKIINQYNCGLVVEPDNPQALASAIIKLYNDRNLRETLGANGRKAAENLFSREVAVTKYENIIKKLARR